jgi:hypothetical protein
VSESRRDAVPPERILGAPILAAETLRTGSTAAAEAPAKEEKTGIPMVWRIFGGTVLSVMALLAVTLYQQLFNKVENLSSQLLKREEFFDFRKGIWDYIQKFQNAEQATDGELQQRCTRLEQQAKQSDDQHKEIVPELRQMRDMLLTYLKDGEERKKLLAEIQQLRERLAAMEAQKSPSRVNTAAYERKD